jgi:4-aminobutyrate aminotransferase-like enzyme
MAIEHNNEPLSNEVRKRSDAIIGKGQGTFTPSLAVVNKALGCRLWTIDGLELIDFTSGVLVTNLGHAHPLFESLQAEYARFLPRSSYNMLTTVEVRAAERLIASAGLPKAERVLYAASGSEGIQKAMWAAMHKHPDRPILLATRHGFHGKKGLAGEVTGFESANPNVRFISFPMEDERPSSFYEAELDQLAAEYPNQIALLITEPYLGAAGSFHPPAWYHQLLQRWCEAHDVEFIFDEVQSCFGRTGNMYAFQSYGIEPDL